ncbi:MAG: hypothetical protein HRU11_05525 [Parvularculaceae bacterium]|nr:hypothetical protein [Parvularculaceae bacterium]
MDQARWWFETAGPQAAAEFVVAEDARVAKETAVDLGFQGFGIAIEGIVGAFAADALFALGTGWALISFSGDGWPPLAHANAQHPEKPERSSRGMACGLTAARSDSHSRGQPWSEGAQTKAARHPVS